MQQLDIEMWTGKQQVWTCYTEHAGHRYITEDIDPQEAAAALLKLVQRDDATVTLE